MTIKAYEELDRFEQGIVEHLVDKKRYNHEDAVRLCAEYAPVLEQLQKHYNFEDYAEWIHEARANGLTPARWSDRIAELDRPAQSAKKSVRKSKTVLQ